MIVLTHRIISVIFVVCVVTNLILAFRISRGIKKNFYDYWISIGAPSNLDPFGQMAYERLFFNKKLLPDEIRLRYATAINWLVIVRVVGFLSFLLIIVLALAFPDLFNGHPNA